MEKNDDKIKNPLAVKLGAKIKAARLKKGLTHDQIGTPLGVTPQAVQQWEAGETMPKRQRLPELAQLIDVSPAELWFPETLPITDVRPRAANVEYQLQRVPIISWAAVAKWSESTEPFEQGMADIWEPVDVQVGPRAFALTVRGDSMEPRFPDGCVIVVDPSAEVRSGDFVIAHSPSWAEATFKRYVIDAGIKYLKPLNQAYRTQTVEPDVSILGKVVHWRFGGPLP